jgi:hypothetical protein
MIDSGGRAPSELATYGPLAISSAVSNHGTHSLAIPATVPNATSDFIVIRVPLCSSGQAIDLTGKSMGFNIRMVTAADSPNLLAGAQGFGLLYAGPTSVMAGLTFSPANDVARGDSPWLVVSGDIATLFGFSGPATHAGLLFLVPEAWKGTVYVDDFKIF